ncbi:uncharacterized protein LOC130635428 [Hydractinia symbiolongicarpus]|uniref:uncharacterized protein LOC130635428 n=1 Tax=Hydractinia symbiolongicarpus TaxID=13093 RepID=UPI00254B1804|nr:uncharacterized protein LOC130635428 [Hydractinia symbiolongicarpus]
MKVLIITAMIIASVAAFVQKNDPAYEAGYNAGYADAQARRNDAFAGYGDAPTRRNDACAGCGDAQARTNDASAEFQFPQSDREAYNAIRSCGGSWKNCNGCRGYLSSCCSSKNCSGGRSCRRGQYSYSCS